MESKYSYRNISGVCNSLFNKSGNRLGNPVYTLSSSPTSKIQSKLLMNSPNFSTATHFQFVLENSVAPVAPSSNRSPSKIGTEILQTAIMPIVNSFANFMKMTGKKSVDPQTACLKGTNQKSFDHHDNGLADLKELALFSLLSENNGDPSTTTMYTTIDSFNICDKSMSKEMEANKNCGEIDNKITNFNNISTKSPATMPIPGQLDENSFELLSHAELPKPTVKKTKKGKRKNKSKKKKFKEKSNVIAGQSSKMNELNNNVNKSINSTKDDESIRLKTTLTQTASIIKPEVICPSSIPQTDEQSQLQRQKLNMQNTSWTFLESSCDNDWIILPSDNYIFQATLACIQSVPKSPFLANRQRQISESSDDFICFEWDDDTDDDDDDGGHLIDNGLKLDNRCPKIIEDIASSFDSTVEFTRNGYLSDNDNSNRKVRFNLNVQVHEMRTWNFAYRQARKGIWEQIALDRVRFENRIHNLHGILKPILEPMHRQKIYNERFNSGNF